MASCKPIHGYIRSLNNHRNVILNASRSLSDTPVRTKKVIQKKIIKRRKTDGIATNDDPIVPIAPRLRITEEELEDKDDAHVTRLYALMRETKIPMKTLPKEIVTPQQEQVAEFVHAQTRRLEDMMRHSQQVNGSVPESLQKQYKALMNHPGLEPSIMNDGVRPEEMEEVEVEEEVEVPMTAAEVAEAEMIEEAQRVAEELRVAAAERARAAPAAAPASDLSDEPFPIHQRQPLRPLRLQIPAHVQQRMDELQQQVRAAGLDDPERLQAMRRPSALPEGERGAAVSALNAVQELSRLTAEWHRSSQGQGQWDGAEVRQEMEEREREAAAAEREEEKQGFFSRLVTTVFRGEKEPPKEKLSSLLDPHSAGGTGRDFTYDMIRQMQPLEDPSAADATADAAAPEAVEEAVEEVVEETQPPAMETPTDSAATPAAAPLAAPAGMHTVHRTVAPEILARARQLMKSKNESVSQLSAPRPSPYVDPTYNPKPGTHDAAVANARVQAARREMERKPRGKLNVEDVRNILVSHQLQPHVATADAIAEQHEISMLTVLEELRQRVSNSVITDMTVGGFTPVVYKVRVADPKKPVPVQEQVQQSVLFVAAGVSSVAVGADASDLRRRLLAVDRHGYVDMLASDVLVPELPPALLEPAIRRQLSQAKTVAASATDKQVMGVGSDRPVELFMTEEDNRVQEDVAVEQILLLRGKTLKQLFEIGVFQPSAYEGAQSGDAEHITGQYQFTDHVRDAHHTIAKANLELKQRIYGRKYTLDDSRTARPAAQATQEDLDDYGVGNETAVDTSKLAPRKPRRRPQANDETARELSEARRRMEEAGAPVDEFSQLATVASIMAKLQHHPQALTKTGSQTRSVLDETILGTLEDGRVVDVSAEELESLKQRSQTFPLRALQALLQSVSVPYITKESQGTIAYRLALRPDERVEGYPEGFFHPRMLSLHNNAHQVPSAAQVKDDPVLTHAPYGEQARDALDEEDMARFVHVELSREEYDVKASGRAWASNHAAVRSGKASAKPAYDPAADYTRPSVLGPDPNAEPAPVAAAAAPSPGSERVYEDVSEIPDWEDLKHAAFAAEPVPEPAPEAAAQEEELQVSAIDEERAAHFRKSFNHIQQSPLAEASALGLYSRARGDVSRGVKKAAVLDPDEVVQHVTGQDPNPAAAAPKAMFGGPLAVQAYLENLARQRQGRGQKRR